MAGGEKRRVDDLLDIIPPQSNQAYDMRQVLSAICDTDSLLELQPGFGKNIIVAVAKMGGTACMLVANQPTIQAGAITVDAADKATHFIEVATNFKLPLITVLDNPGVMPGPAAESRRENVPRPATLSR